MLITNKWSKLHITWRYTRLLTVWNIVSRERKIRPFRFTNDKSLDRKIIQHFWHFWKLTFIFTTKSSNAETIHKNVKNFITWFMQTRRLLLFLLSFLPFFIICSNWQKCQHLFFCQFLTNFENYANRFFKSF